MLDWSKPLLTTVIGSAHPAPIFEINLHQKAGNLALNGSGKLEGFFKLLFYRVGSIIVFVWEIIRCLHLRIEVMHEYYKLYIFNVETSVFD